MLKYAVKDISNISDDQYAKSFSYMSNLRKRHTERIKNEVSKKSTLAGEWLVRTLLSEETGNMRESFVITYDEQGKPYLENMPDIFFNISHSKTKVAAVISDKNVGIDIELVRPVFLKLAPRVFNDRELIYIFDCEPDKINFDMIPDDALTRRFLEIWTLKEAYFKCLGTGITNFESMKIMKQNFEKIKIEEEAYIMHIVTMT